MCHTIAYITLIGSVLNHMYQVREVGFSTTFAFLFRKWED